MLTSFRVPSAVEKASRMVGPELNHVLPPTAIVYDVESEENTTSSDDAAAADATRVRRRQRRTIGARARKSINQIVKPILKVAASIFLVRSTFCEG